MNFGLSTKGLSTAPTLDFLSEPTLNIKGMRYGEGSHLSGGVNSLHQFPGDLDLVCVLLLLRAL